MKLIEKLALEWFKSQIGGLNDRVILADNADFVRIEAVGAAYAAGFEAAIALLESKEAHEHEYEAGSNAWAEWLKDKAESELPTFEQFKRAVELATIKERDET